VRRGALAALLVLAAGCGGDPAGDGRAAFDVRPVRPGGPAGLAARDGQAWRLVVWGLRPESAHRVELGASCRGGRRAATVAANANGVAYGRFAGAGDVLLVRSTDGPTAVVACGPRGALRAAEVSAAGPGAAARTGRASGLLQLGEGAGAVVVRGRAGEEVALAVRSRRPGEVRVLGIAVQVGPGTIARFSVRPPRAGTFPVRFGGAVVGRLVVRP
jgi:hypothetical protein